MNVFSIVTYTGAVLSTALAAAALVRNGKSPVNLSFAAGMLALAAERVFALFGMQAVLPSDVLAWECRRIAAMSLLPGCWLIFSLGFARENYRQFLARWRGAVVAAFAVPICLAAVSSVYSDLLFSGVGHAKDSTAWVLPLGLAGTLFHVVFLLAMVSVLVNLERTLRASFGTQRWRIKFTLLGLGALFAVRIYSTAQVLLFSQVDMRLFPPIATTLVIADLMVIVSSLRASLRKVDIYVSQEVLYNSLTLVVAGVYLLALGVAAKVSTYFGLGEALLHNAFFAFLLFLGIAVILLSDHVRQEVRRFVHRHFRRPLYDYRQIWQIFTERTGSLFEIRDLCAATAKTVSETFGVSSVSLWLLDANQERPSLGGSTALSVSRHGELKDLEREIGVLMVTMRGKTTPLDLHRPDWGTPPDDGEPAVVPSPPDATIRYCAPLSVGGEFLGLMTLNDRMTREVFTPEDFDLLKTIADQAAGMLLNHRLYESLGRAREMEAFQTLSTFF
ncbi:MAG: GAF domain-containing protein, partial [Syntrophobacteraceae bacterium]